MPMQFGIEIPSSTPAVLVEPEQTFLGEKTPQLLDMKSPVSGEVAASLGPRDDTIHSGERLPGIHNVKPLDCGG